jgi:hypothetical protein
MDEGTELACCCDRARRRSEWRSADGYLPQELGYHRHFTVAAFLEGTC